MLNRLVSVASAEPGIEGHANVANKARPAGVTSTEASETTNRPAPFRQFFPGCDPASPPGFPGSFQAVLILHIRFGCAGEGSGPRRSAGGPGIPAGGPPSPFLNTLLRFYILGERRPAIGNAADAESDHDPGSRGGITHEIPGGAFRSSLPEIKRHCEKSEMIHADLFVSGRFQHGSLEFVQSSFGFAFRQVGFGEAPLSGLQPGYVVA